MGFIFNQNAGETPETIARKRMIAQAMQQQGTDTSAIQHPLQGVARIAQALSGNWANSRLDKAEKQGRAGASDNFARVMAALTQGGAPQPAMAPQMAPSQPSATPAPKGNTFQNMLQVESGGNPNAVSPKGATGIAQIMPATARDPGFGLPNIFDYAKGQGVQVADNSDATLQALLRNPKVNAGFGEAYFNAQKQRYGGDERLAAAAYNAGPGAVDKAGGVPNIPETQAYVRKLGLNGPQPQQVAQAQPQQPQIQPASMQTGPDAAAMQQLMALASNPWVNDGEKAMIQTMLQRELAKSDPATQLALQKAQLELQGLQNPKPKYEQVGGTLLEVGQGGVKPIWSAPEKPDAPRTEITEIDGRRKLINSDNGATIKDLGAAPSKQSDYPTGYEADPSGQGMRRIKGYRDTNLEMDMRKEFDAQTKDFRAVRDSFNRIQASADNPTPAGDLSLIFNYMKMLDPGSVVRESEFAVAANAAPLLTRYGLDPEKLQGVWEGQKLTPEQRADFLTRAEQLYGEQDATFQGLADAYSETAKRNGLAPENIILTPRSNPRKKKPADTNNGWSVEEVQ